MAKMAQEACERTMQLEVELEASKSEVIQKKRLLFGCGQSQQQFQIEGLKTTFFNEQYEYFVTEAYRQEHAVLNLWGNKFYQQDPSVAPICGALI
ncbi:fatty acid synthase alpha subunit Lsd1, partial [Massospora cicadina]